ncbi:unnamed protein product, partial [Rotaria sp. Silwood2]
LKQYINTNESDLQAVVVDLLVQLLLIRHFLTHIIYELEIIEETIAGYDVLSHDILHSKQVIKLQDLLKNCDEFLATGHERNTYGSIAFGYLFHTINTINVISSVELRKIDPFVVAFET